MALTKLEKVVFTLLTALLAVGLLLFVASFCEISGRNEAITKEVFERAADSRADVLEKSGAYIDEFNDTKLNLNRTDEKSIAALPGVTKPLAKKIYAFITSKGRINKLDELLEIQGFNRKKLENIEKYATVTGGHGGSAAWGDKLNINFASAEDFKSLPGIGKKLAEQIVEFRNNNGGFSSVEDLLEIQGVTEEKFSGIADKIKVN